MTWLTTVLLGFTAYRLGRLAAQEDGPFDAATRIRARLGQRTWVGRGAHCIACCSFWVAGIGALVIVVTDRAVWGDLWLLWFGSAGLALAIYQVVR
jgi:hypothetical protein